MAKATVKSVKAKDFAISVPVGSEELHINKGVIRALLQEKCNLEIEDFEVVEGNGKQSVVIKFTPNEV